MVMKARNLDLQLGQPIVPIGKLIFLDVWSQKSQSAVTYTQVRIAQGD
jgi:hypothetical protein